MARPPRDLDIPTRLAFDGLPSLSQVVRQHELMAKKSLGQNFLFDLNLTAKIARHVPVASRAADQDTTGCLIEIGPGPGGLTRALLHETDLPVFAIEKDARCLAALAEIADHYPGRLQVIEGDATTLDLAGLASAPRHVAANLPYNIGTTLLTAWLAREAATPGSFASMTLMFQREVALRITAQQGDKHYGRLAVLASWLCHCERLFDIPPEAFTPAPKVTSSVVQLIPRKQPLLDLPLTALEKVSQAAFGQRRKMLRQSLKGLALAPEALCEAANVAPTQRAEEVPVLGYCRMAAALGG